MKCLKGSLVAIVVLLLVGISGTVFAADEAIVDVQITINTKYELTITSGQTVGAMLDSHAVHFLVPKHHNLMVMLMKQNLM